MKRDANQADAVHIARELCRLDWKFARIRVMVERGDPVAMLAVRRLAKAIAETTNEMARRVFS